nr:MAG TPA: tail assembly chaperone protein [Caudoviricetes sp.]
MKGNDNMANAIDLLLNANVEDFERPSKIVEIPRLSKILGDKFELKLKALSINKINKLRMECVNQTTKEVDIPKLQMKMLTEGALDTENETYFFKNKNIQKAYKVPNAEELINKILVMGEVDFLYDEIDSLSDLSEDIEEIEEEVKN